MIPHILSGSRKSRALPLQTQLKPIQLHNFKVPFLNQKLTFVFVHASALLLTSDLEDYNVTLGAKISLLNVHGANRQPQFSDTY